MSIEELVEKKLGYVFSEEGVYEPDQITFTVELGSRVEIGDIVCIEHPSRKGIPVFYQVVEVPLRRKARDYEEDLARAGKPLIDESRNYPRARAKQIGYIDSVEKLLSGKATLDDLLMLIEHIEPFSEVYMPQSRIIEKLLEPAGPSIEVGRVYPSWKYWLKLDLPRLLRQGLLVVGGIGTGKTTTMLSVLVRTIKKIKELGGVPHVLIIDKDGEYGTRELIEAAGTGGYKKIHVDEIGMYEYYDKEEYSKELRGVLGYPDLRSKAAKILHEAITRLREDTLILRPDFVEEKIISQLRQKLLASRDSQTLSDITSRFNRWKTEYEKTAGEQEYKYTVSDVAVLLKDKIVVHLDLSMTRDFNHAFTVLNALLKKVYDEAITDTSFGCIIAVDEAHLFCPERGGIMLADDKRVGSLRDALHLIATTGARNGVTLFMATQRPSLISKTITTQMGQNIIVHRVEDIDLERIEEIVGGIARRVRVLPRGWAIVKALAAKIREPLIVRVVAETVPASTGKTTYDRFLQPL